MKDAEVDLAKLDAEAAMLEDGELPPDIYEALSKADLGYYAAFVVFRKDGSYEFGVETARAETPEEAAGFIYVDLRERFPRGDGWLPPDIKVDEPPVGVFSEGSAFVVP